MVVSTFNNILFTGTERVKAHQGMKMVRNTTASTANTASMTLSSAGSYFQDMSSRDFSSNEFASQDIAWQDTSVSSLPDSSEADQDALFVRMIAREMMHSLANTKEESDGLANGTSHRLPNLSLKGISAEDIYSSVDRELRKALREKLDESASEAEAPSRCVTTPSGSSVADSCATSASMLVQQPKAPMDIWHPDFWNEAEEKEESVIVGTQEDKVDLSQLLENFKEITSDSSDDDASAMSEISGLTGAFPDYPAERRMKRRESQIPARAELTGRFKSAVFSGTKVKKHVAPRSVSFSDVQVRVYKRMISDNPSCTKGAAIGIDWDYEAVTPASLEDWEMERRRLRRPQDLVLSRCQRDQLLRELGYSDKEIAATVREINRVKQNRRQTVQNLGSQKMEAMEAAKKRVFKVLSLSGKKSSSSSNSSVASRS
jgi:hypothetical protein